MFRYEYVLFLVISKPNKEINLYIKEAIFADMHTNQIKHSVFFETGRDDENLNTLSDYILENVFYSN